MTNKFNVFIVTLKKQKPKKKTPTHTHKYVPVFTQTIFVYKTWEWIGSESLSAHSLSFHTHTLNGGSFLAPFFAVIFQTKQMAYESDMLIGKGVHVVWCYDRVVLNFFVFRPLPPPTMHSMMFTTFVLNLRLLVLEFTLLVFTMKIKWNERGKETVAENGILHL